MKYNLVSVGDVQNLTLFHDGEMYVADNTHPNFTKIVEGVLNDDTKVVDLFDIGKTVAKKFEHKSERVSVSNGRVYFDGDEVENALTKQILRCLEEGIDDVSPLVNFFEKVAQNPQEHSREQLYRWLDRHDFTICPDGDFIAYKGVQERDGQIVSIRSGPAIVNGESVNGYVPNPIGAVVEMPRSSVHHNPAVGCSTGLHAGTFAYAKDFGRIVLKVKINPRDAVSVPTDSGDQKLRVCRYMVIEQVTKPVDSAVDYSYDEYDDEDFCEYCGEHLDDCECEDNYGDVAVSVIIKDTRLNHKTQKRDANGRFIK